MPTLIRRLDDVARQHVRSRRSQQRPRSTGGRIHHVADRRQHARDPGDRQDARTACSDEVSPSRSLIQAHSSAPNIESGTPKTDILDPRMPEDDLRDLARMDTLAAAYDHVPAGLSSGYAAMTLGFPPRPGSRRTRSTIISRSKQDLLSDTVRSAWGRCWRGPTRRRRRRPAGRRSVSAPSWPTPSRTISRRSRTFSSRTSSCGPSTRRVTRRSSRRDMALQGCVRRHRSTLIAPGNGIRLRAGRPAALRSGSCRPA